MVYLIILVLLMMIITVALIYSCVKLYKRTTSKIEKTIYIVLMIIYFIPIIIFLFDKFDIPTRIGYTSNIDTDRWFNFITSYISNIVGTFISGTILILITIKQIRVQNESNKEDKRIQVAPILDYTLKSDTISNCGYSHNVKLKGIGKPYHVFFRIDNIGLGHSKNVSMQIKVDDEEDNRMILNGHQSFIKKNESLTIDLIFNLDDEKDNKRTFSLDVYYDDLLNNKYIQRLSATLSINKEKHLELNDINIDDPSFIVS